MKNYQKAIVEALGFSFFPLKFARAGASANTLLLMFFIFMFNYFLHVPVLKATVPAANP